MQSEPLQHNDVINTDNNITDISVEPSQHVVIAEPTPTPVIRRSTRNRRMPDRYQP